MFKLLTTLMRGAAAQAEEDLANRNALLILDQQIRDARAALERGRQALAIAMAQDQAEVKRLADTRARIADLEARATAALKAGRDDLGLEAAEAIATLETDAQAIAEAQATFAGEARRLKAHVAAATHRFTEVERGRRLAQAAESVRKLRKAGDLSPALPGSPLADAEATLQRLRTRQHEEQAVDANLAALDGTEQAGGIGDRLEQAGFGPRSRPHAEDVLARLKARAAEQEAV